MKNVKLLILTTALGVGVAMQPASGQLPVSRPGAVIQKVIKGGSLYSAIGVPFTREPAARAVVLSAAASTVNVSGTPFTAGAFSAVPHTLVVVTGTARGQALPIVSNTASSVTVAGTLPALIADADEFEIVPDWTLGSLFGTGANPSSLASNANAALADIVYATNGGVLTQYHHNGTNWRTVGGAATSRNNLSLGLNGGALVLKRSAGDLNFLVKGTLRSGLQKNAVVPNFSLQSYSDPVATTLGTSGLVPGVLTANANSALADVVYIADPVSGALTQYFHNTTNWRTVGGAATNRNGIAITPQAAILINKRSAGTSEWIITETFVP